MARAIVDTESLKRYEADFSVLWAFILRAKVDEIAHARVPSSEEARSRPHLLDVLAQLHQNPTQFFHRAFEFAHRLLR